MHIFKFAGLPVFKSYCLQNAKKCILRRLNFQNFRGEHTPHTPRGSRLWRTFGPSPRSIAPSRIKTCSRVYFSTCLFGRKPDNKENTTRNRMQHDNGNTLIVHSNSTLFSQSERKCWVVLCDAQHPWKSFALIWLDGILFWSYTFEWRKSIYIRCAFDFSFGKLRALFLFPSL